MNLLFVGDIVGKGGRKAAKTLVPEIRRKYNCSFCIANGENSAGGSGINEKCINDLLGSDGYIDVITLGDHVWAQKSFAQEIKSQKNVLRPANLNPKQPGYGYKIFRVPAGGEIAVINLLGTIYMKDGIWCPFEEITGILNRLPSRIKCIFVDFHAEATSEKIAMGRLLDGKVTAVLGTHTHVQTADAVILPGGTAYITDAGMVGADFSILGRSVEDVVSKFTDGMPRRLNVVEKGIIRLDAVVVSYNIKTGRAEKIQPVSCKIQV
ncbi:MAG: YmdB family metallophosphoesterase [Victivallales bacterium]|nr:YmdB family metallophosphoesterase [Victivallales bacterium]